MAQMLLNSGESARSQYHEITISGGRAHLGDHHITNNIYMKTLEEATEQLNIKELTSGPQRIYEVPNLLVPDFVGREQVLAQIEIVFKNQVNNGPQFVVLRAMGGQGKTQVALLHCQRMKESTLWPILWIDATSESSLKQSFSSIAPQFQVPSNLQDIDSRANFVVRKLTDWPEPWLIIYDNHDEPKQYNIRRWIPINKGGMVLITTRDAEVEALAVKTGGGRIALPELSQPEALELLFQHSDVDCSDSETSDHGTAIVERLGCHALAIAQAGTYIQLRNLPLGDFLKEFDLRKAKILKDTTPQMSQYWKRLGESEEQVSLSVFTTWELSYQQLLRQDTAPEHWADLLTLLAFFDAGGVSEDLFRSYCNNDPFEDEEGKLPMGWVRCWNSDGPPSYVNYLVNNDVHYIGRPETGTPSHNNNEVSALNPDTIQLRKSSELEAAPGSFLAKYKDNWDSNAYCGIIYHLQRLSLTSVIDKTSKKATLHPLVRDWIILRTGYRDYIPEYSSLAATCVYRQIWLTIDGRVTNLAIEMRHELERHIKEYQKLSNNLKLQPLILRSDPQSADSGFPGNLFSLLFNYSGKHSEAEFWCRWSLGKRQQQFGPSAVLTRKCTLSLGIILRCQRKLEQAEQLLREFLVDCPNSLGPEGSETLQVMRELGGLLTERSKYAESEGMLREILKRQRELLGDGSRETIQTIHHLAHCLENSRKDPMEAVTMYRRALELAEATLGISDLITVESMNKLAGALNALGEKPEVERMLRKFLLRGDIKDNIHVLDGRRILAGVVGEQGRLAEAEVLLLDIIARCERAMGHEHTLTLACKAQFATLLQKQKKYPKAAEFWKAAFTGCKSTLGAKHEITLICMENYAKSLGDMG